MKRKRSELVVGAVAVALIVALPAGAVVARGDGGRQVSQAGAAQARSGPYMTGLPAVSGTPQEGETLTATPGTWGGTTPITYSYRWQRCGLTELITNPGIEAGAEGWSGRRGATVSQSGEQAHGGGSSLEVQTPGKQMSEGASYQLSSVTPGASYTFRAWAWVATETTFVVGIRYYDAAGAEIGGGPVTGRWGGLWSQIAVTVTAPAGAASATVEMTTDRIAGTFYVDDASFLDCANISGATSASYPVVAADAGFRLLIRVAASNSVNTTWAVSDPTAMALDKWSTAPAYTGPVFADNTEAATADPPLPPPVLTTLPTWRNLYDWPNGHGYVGWHYNTSATDSRYSSATNHGGNHGLWIWPTGNQQYTPNHAEWTYTAPGTTRISTANLTLAYRNKLLAHHCIQVGLRTLDGTTIQEYKWCQPALPPDSQRDVSVTLQDPLNNPTTKVLYFRVEMPQCNNPDPTPCSKYIPTLDPLGPGGYARLKLADMILVDDDNPTLAPSGPLWDIKDHFIDGTQSYDVGVAASDAGSGIKRAWLDHGGAGELAGQDAPCDPAHNTPPLDSRICPPDFAFPAAVATPPFPEGRNVFTERARDVAGNVGSTSWNIFIDRTSPADVTASGSFYDLRGTTTDGWEVGELTISARDPGREVEKASGIARVWVEEVGVGVLASSANGACTSLICPDTYAATFQIDVNAMTEGTHTFLAKAEDAVGHVTDGPSWSFTIDRTPPSEAPTGVSEVVFESPVPVADAVARAEAEAKLPTQLVSEIVVASGEQITLTYLPASGDTGAQIVDGYPDMMQGLIEDLALSGEDMAGAPADPLVDRMVLSDGATLSAFSVESSDSASDTRTLQSADAASASQCPEPWWPSFGRIDVLPSARTHDGVRLRYVYQTFTWSLSRLANLQCDPESTYEADAVFYNFGSFEHYLQLDGILGTATNLRDSYIDTQVDDNLKRPTWTIGTSDADKLVAGKSYFTMIRTFPGTAQTERAVAQGQIGDIPSWCPQFAAQLCIFANDSELLLDANPNRTFELDVPGRASWTH